MAYEELLACLDQEEVLLTRIRDLSVQIEVRCGLPDPVPGELVQQRQVYFDRLKKCRARAAALLGKLESGERGRLNAVLSSGLKRDECSAEELPLLERGSKCRSLVREAAAADRESLERLKKERDRLQKLVGDSRRGKGTRLFGNYAG